MDGSDTPEEFSKWEEAVEDAIEEAQLQGCWSKLALWQRRSGDGGPEGSGKGLAKIRRRSDGGPAKVRRRSGEGLAAVRQRSGRGGSSSGDDRGRGNDDEKKKWWAHNPQVPGSEPGSDTMLRIKKIGIEINLPCV